MRVRARTMPRERQGKKKMPTKQKSGLYRTKVKIGVNADGKDILKYVSGRTKKELEDAKREVIARYISGETTAADCLFGEYAVKWYKTMIEPKLAASSRESYRTALNKDITPVFGDRNLRAIGMMDLQAFVNQYARCSATKITYIIASLNGIFEFACANNILRENPMAHVTKPKATPPKEKAALTTEQRERIEAECNRNPDALYMALMFYMGLRPGEARGLQWGDIDWTKKTVHIQRDIDYKDGGKAGKLKTEKSNRIVPLPEPLQGILGKFRGLPDVFIVHGERGGALAKTSAERLWVQLMRNCGMVEPMEESKYRASDIRSQYRATITPHALRHNYATTCWESGLDAYTTMRLMGHASIKTTMDIYTHLNDAQIDKMHEKIDAMFRNKSCTKVAQEEESRQIKK